MTVSDDAALVAERNKLEVRDPEKDVAALAPIRWADSVVQRPLLQAIMNSYQAEDALRGLSQDQLARDVAMSKTSINNILNGKGPVRPDQAVKLWRRLGFNLKKALPEKVHGVIAQMMGRDDLPDMNEGWKKTCLNVVTSYFNDIGEPFDQVRAHKLAELLAEDSDSMRTSVAELKLLIQRETLRKY